VPTGNTVLSHASKANMTLYFILAAAAVSRVSSGCPRENCEKKTLRLMRQFHRRPYFLPPMVEVVDRGWIFISA